MKRFRTILFLSSVFVLLLLVLRWSSVAANSGLSNRFSPTSITSHADRVGERDSAIEQTELLSDASFGLQIPAPTATTNPPATSTAIAPTPSPIPLPTAAPSAAGWAWYENTAHAYRIVHPETWSVRSVTQPSGLIHQAIFTLVDEEPPVLPPEWQPYAERPTLAYSLVNADGYVEIEELFVQDGPCDVTPLTTHCQAWLQIYPTSSADR